MPIKARTAPFTRTLRKTPLIYTRDAASKADVFTHAAQDKDALPKMFDYRDACAATFVTICLICLSAAVRDSYLFHVYACYTARYSLYSATSSSRHAIRFCPREREAFSGVSARACRSLRDASDIISAPDTYGKRGNRRRVICCIPPDAKTDASNIRRSHADKPPRPPRVARTRKRCDI